MGVNSKGFYFSLDALLALMMLSAVFGLLLQMYSVENISPRMSEGSNTALNGLKLPSTNLNSSIVEKSDYKNKESVLTTLKEYYVEGKISKSRKLAKEYFKNVDYEASIYLVNSSSSVKVYNTTMRKASKEVRSDLIVTPDRNNISNPYSAVRVVVWN